MLDTTLSQGRMGTFLAAAGSDPVLARELYVWNRDLSMAILADIAMLEIAMRNAIDTALIRQWGPRWYESGPTFDQRTMGALATAWGRIPNGRKSNRNDTALPGRLVANCMFGFWTNLLDEGGPIAKGPRDAKADYDALWLVIRREFKGARAEAKASGVKYRREWVHGVVKIVNDLRNRAAHHEPLINGFPLNGQQRRLTAQQGHDSCLKLARMLDSHLAAWIESTSTVPHLLATRPTTGITHAARCVASAHVVAAGYPDY
ncbi:hypothetical protein IM877_15985 [Rhodococcus sp. GG48]|nr:hypothetical protein [Rhodococcus sp. GG48]